MANPEKFSEEYRGMTPEQLNSEFHQIFGFITRSDRFFESNDRVVYLLDANRRLHGEVSNVLNKKLIALLDFAPITIKFKEGIYSLFRIDYVILSGFDKDGQSYADILLQENKNIFNPEQAREIERMWYRKKYSDVIQAIEWVVRSGLSTKDNERWRMDVMEKWRKEFVECHEEEP